ncbi:MAG TPA: DNA polymerase I [Lachnospiraceae bacterium]|nr:DNA polymerase I [Lachnospiraceae bacterium]
MREKILLIDGHSMLNRGYYGVPLLTNSKGVHTNAVLGFLNIMFKVISEEAPDYIAVAFDEHAPTFRHEMYEAYKGTRHAMPEELKEQVPLIREVLQAMNILTVSRPGLEADDIIGTISRRAMREDREAVILSGDRDLLQLVTADSVKVRLPHTSKGVTTVDVLYAADVKEKYGVTPEGIIELKALMGDSSDNIPGVPKIGEKTGVSLVQQYGNIENLKEHIGEITKRSIRETLEQNFDMAVLSKKLATIDVNAEIEFTWEAAAKGDLFNASAYGKFMELELKSLYKYFDDTTTAAVEESAKHEFEEIRDLGEIEAVFAEVKKAKKAGIAFDEDGVYLVLSPDRAVAIPAEGFASPMFLKAHVTDILDGGSGIYYTFDIKGQLKHMEVPCSPKLRDLLLADYLLNPLIDDYGVPEDTGEKAYAAYIRGEERYKELCDAGMERLYADIEMPLAFVLHDMEKEGIRASKETLESISADLEKDILKLEQEIYADAGEEFNINSPKQLGVILFEKMGLPGGKKTKSGYSTAADVLEKLAEDQPIVAKILGYRSVYKLKNTYTDALADYIDDSGRIHSTFNQTVTATGRLSSADPNLQNIPIRTERGRELRRVFIPREGWSFTDADYSQIELRILASLSGDEKLIKAFLEGQDIHASTAAHVFHVDYDEVTPQMRRNAKAVNFGIVYGISSFGLSENLSISRAEAKEYIDQYFETFPRVKAYLDELVASAKQSGAAVTYFGRRRPIPELKESNFMRRQFGERVAMNMPVQGTAADIMKIAMVRVHEMLKESGLQSRLILQIHDELLIETAPGEEEQVERILKEGMMGAASLAVPLTVDVNRGRDFYDAH